MNPLVCTAAEVSGDRLAAAVLAEVARLRPAQRWTGWAGERMRTVPGFTPLGDVAELSAAGFAEVLPRLPALLRARRSLGAAMAGASLSVVVDAPDLHGPLLARAPGRRVWLAVPQWWAWRPGRLDRMASFTHLALCLMPWEVGPLRARGVAAFFVGHPATELALAPPIADRSVAVLPGSRPSEVRRHLDPFLEAARLAGATRIEVPWRLAAAPPVRPGVGFVRDEGAVVLARCRAAIVAVGTASLEAACLGVPHVAAALPARSTRWLARRLLRVPRVALPNLIVGRSAVPEVLGQVAPLGTELARALESDRDAALAAEIRAVLGTGFAQRAASAILPSIDP